MIYLINLFITLKKLIICSSMNVKHLLFSNIYVHELYSKNKIENFDMVDCKD